MFYICSFLSFLATMVFLLSSAEAQLHPAKTPIFSSKNLFAKDFALDPMELVLTFDDGPGEGTLEFARLLAKFNPPIPAVFFMVGEPARKRIGVVEEVSKIRGPDGAPLFLIANHSLSHLQLTKIKSDEALRNQLSFAHDVLAPFMTGFKYFRAPYGSFFSPGVRNRVLAQFNSLPESRDYIGPVYWDVGGFYSSSTSPYWGDWSCWQKVNGKDRFTVEQCRDGYLSDITQVKSRGQIILAHDSHVKTIQMFAGKQGIPNDPESLIQRLLDQGYRFVRLDKDREVNEVLRAGVK